MMATTRFMAGLIALCLLAGAASCADRSPYSGYPPLRFGDDIAKFERQDAGRAPQEGAILFIGSSSIRLWASSLGNDMAPLQVLARGFGGSNMNDVNYFYDRIVAPYKPSAIVLYVGENDIVQGVKPDQLLAAYRRFVSRVQSDFPQANIYYLSIKPAPARRSAWRKMQAANAVIKSETQGDERLFFVDVATAMLDTKGGARDDLHVSDGIHMNRGGYRIWTDILKPLLLENES